MRDRSRNKFRDRSGNKIGDGSEIKKRDGSGIKIENVPNSNEKNTFYRAQKSV